MRRRLFTLAAAISLAMCLAVAWTWAHPGSSSGVRRVIVEIPVGGHIVELSELTVQPLGEQMILGWLPGDNKQIEAQTPPPGTVSKRSFWGVPGVIILISVDIWNGEGATGIMASQWFLVLLTAAVPLLWAWRWTRSALRRLVRSRRARLGLCVRCAYDLRGTPRQCPECGAVAESAGGSPHNPLGQDRASGKAISSV
jgi:hypothetical protein